MSALQDSKLLVFMERCRHVTNEDELISLINGGMSLHLPHQMASCAILIIDSFEIINGFSVGFPQQYADLIHKDNRLVCPLADAWRKTRSPVMINNVNELMVSNSTWVQNAHIYGLKNFLAHGIADISGKLASCVCLVNNPYAWTGEHVRVMELIVPQLHVALVRVLSKYTRNDFNQLITKRELEILRWIYHGKSNEEIAQILSIQFSTVKTHVHRILEKLGARNRAQAITRALELRLPMSD